MNPPPGGGTARVALRPLLCCVVAPRAGRAVAGFLGEARDAMPRFAQGGLELPAIYVEHIQSYGRLPPRSP